MNWKKFSRTVTKDGTTVLYYPVACDKPVHVESRKRHIPHTNRPGTWDHTSFFVVYGDEDVKELQSLKDAKEYAENFIREKGAKG